MYILLKEAILNVFWIQGPPVGVCVSCTVACVIRQMFSFPDHSACMGPVHPAAPSHHPLLSITDQRLSPSQHSLLERRLPKITGSFTITEKAPTISIRANFMTTYRGVNVCLAFNKENALVGASM